MRILKKFEFPTQAATTAKYDWDAIFASGQPVALDRDTDYTGKDDSMISSVKEQAALRGMPVIVTKEKDKAGNITGIVVFAGTASVDDHGKQILTKGTPDLAAAAAHKALRKEQAAKYAAKAKVKKECNDELEAIAARVEAGEMTEEEGVAESELINARLAALDA